jgi:hypothetical protein
MAERERDGAHRIEEPMTGDVNAMRLTWLTSSQTIHYCRIVPAPNRYKPSGRSECVNCPDHCGCKSFLACRSVGPDANSYMAPKHRNRGVSISGVVRLQRAFACFLLLAAPLGAFAAQAAFNVTVPTLAAPPSFNATIDASWAQAVQLPVLFDFTYQRDGEPMRVYVAQDTKALDVAFVVTQHSAITENAETNGAGVVNDDNVSVLLWPQGSGGFAYSFTANARGARYQSSSENSAYAPDWTAAGRRTPNGYIVTMRIPFDVIRSGASTSWKAQFERVTQATNSTQVWEYVQGQRNAGDRAYAGTLNGIVAHGKAAEIRPKPRLQIYGLGEATTQANGGSTSRIGADLALPVTATSSFVASVHPDYSNVEVDQQTISPSAFARFYSEVRPFFTQLSSNLNNAFGCNNCPTMLYTPSIPTFREGYAYEGAQGPMNFAAFDAVGVGRTDSAQAFSYNVINPKVEAQFSVQRVDVNLPGFSDDTTSVMTGYTSQKTHDFVYWNGAIRYVCNGGHGAAGRESNARSVNPGYPWTVRTDDWKCRCSAASNAEGACARGFSRFEPWS